MTLQTALAQFAQSQTMLDLDEWFALVLAAHKDPSHWRGAWTSLEPADRKALVTLLRKEAGPLSDHILRIIVDNTPPDSDNALLELARDDAADATNRQLERLDELKKRSRKTSKPSRRYSIVTPRSRNSAVRRSA